MYSELQKSLPGVPIEAIKHSDFKKLSGCAKAIIRPLNIPLIQISSWLPVPGI